MSFHQIKSYLKHATSAVNAHGIHSPFVFDLYNEALRDDREYYIFKEIEAYRAKLLNNHKSIHVTDLGAGSHKLKSAERKVSEIAKTSLKKVRQAQLLFRLALSLKPKSVLELGSSLGITTSYLAAARPKTTITTVEGCPEIAAVAKQTFEKLKQGNIQLEVGNFDDMLPNLIQDSAFDFVFLDGNHSYEATVRYVNLLLSQNNPPTVIILDDIYWSKGMTKAWKEIIARPDFQLSLDLFELGILICRPGMEKQDFRLKV